MSSYRLWFVLSSVLLCAIQLTHTYSVPNPKSVDDKRHDKSKPKSSLDCDSIKNFKEIQTQIRSREPDVRRIIDFVVNGKEKHSTYDELALFCDTFGPRPSGSKSLERAIDYMAKKMRDESKLKVSSEKAMIPKWQVYDQSAEITAPIEHPMSILALGRSLGTNGTIEGDVVVVHTFDELKQLGEASKLKDKIVVFNYKFVSYGESVVYRTQGALRASKYGAMAALIRSVTPFSLYSPHAGSASRSIPTAAITLEDADLIQRWVDRKQQVRIKLYIDAKQWDDVESFNTIGDIVGTERPHEVVFVSGHIDSWYDTPGAMDDGGGLMISYKALDVLSKLNLRAKRTMRAILWTAEEPGLIGATQYFKDHKHELDNFKVVIESDEGTFEPLGMSFKNVGPLGQCVLRETLNLTRSMGTNTLDDKYEGSDIEVFTDQGVPGLSLKNENSKYFYFHHTSGDTMTVENPEHLDKSTALFASVTYVLANLDVDLRD